MDVELLEAEAKARATKHVANMLQRPEQLEKLEQYKRRVSRKKASVDAMLKTAMQSQLDGARSGLSDLVTALSSIHEIRQGIQVIDEHMEKIPQLAENLINLRQEYYKYSQYAVALENMKHIFNVPESIKRTQDWITEGQLLLAHQSLADLQHSRDELLFEMHKISNQSPTDKIMLKQYFADVEYVSDELGKQIWLILKRMLNSVRKEPQVMVTALRIIEREEHADKAAAERHLATGFLPSGRPKQWRKKAFKVFEHAVQERIEGNQFQERADDKSWLIKHLEVIRLLTLNDLKVVKTACVPCCPEEYDIFNRFVEMYHNCIRARLQEIINNGLEDLEYVSVLNWINCYNGPELMGDPELGIDTASLIPILDNKDIEALQTEYLNYLEAKYHDWLRKSLETDSKDWRRNVDPDIDGQEHYHTPLPVIVFQMVDQNLQVAKTVNEELVEKVMCISIKKMAPFVADYKGELAHFKVEHFNNRNVIPYFTHYMIASANNALKFPDLLLQLRQLYWKEKLVKNEDEHNFKLLVDAFKDLKIHCIRFLKEELFLDLEKEITDILTRKWLQTQSTISDTICVTIEDYFQDYKHLKPKNFELLVDTVEQNISVAYTTAMLQKKISFKNAEERKLGSQIIVKDGAKFKALFQKLHSEEENPSTWFNHFQSIADFLKLEDTSLLILILSSFVRDYPDINSDQILSLLLLRGDIGRVDSRQVLNDMPSEGSRRPGVTTIFSMIRN